MDRYPQLIEFIACGLFLNDADSIISNIGERHLDDVSAALAGKQ